MTTDDYVRLCDDIDVLRKQETTNRKCLETGVHSSRHEYALFRQLLPDYLLFMSQVAQSHIPYQVNFTGSGIIKVSFPLQERVSKIVVSSLEMPNPLNGITGDENTIQWINIEDTDNVTYSTSVVPGNYTMTTLLDTVLTNMNTVQRKNDGTYHHFICRTNVNGLEKGLVFSSLRNTDPAPSKNPIQVTGDARTVVFTLMQHNLVDNALIYIYNVKEDIGGIPADYFNTSFTVTVLDADHFRFDLDVSATFDDIGGGMGVTVSVPSTFAFRKSPLLSLLGFPDGDSSVSVALAHPENLKSSAPYVVNSEKSTMVHYWFNLTLPNHNLRKDTSFTLLGTQNYYGLRDTQAYIVRSVIDKDTIAIDVPKSYTTEEPFVYYDNINRIRLSSLEDNKIGFAKSQSNVVNGVIYNAVNLSGDTSCYLTCREVDSMAYWSGVPMNSLCKVQMTDIPGYTIFNSQSTDPVMFPSHKRPDLRTLTIELKNSKGQSIDLKNLSMSGCIQLYKESPLPPETLISYV